MAGWRKRVSRWWLDDLFGPRHEVRFALRISTRLAWLRLRLWLRRPRGMGLRRHWPKPVALALVGILVPLGIAAVLSLLFPQEARGVAAAFHRLFTDPEAPRLEWREAAQILLLLIGVPSAFLLWLFRDLNVNATLDNQRKDVNLKEFQEIQMRAAGAIDEKFPAAARETLQIAALHQMRAFLRGEYGKSFQRPAFELLRARLVASAEATDSSIVGNWLQDWRERFRRLEGRDATRAVVEMKREIAGARRKLRPCAIAAAEQIILSEEWEAVLRGSLPLAGSAFDRIQLGRKTVLSGASFIDCRFRLARLRYVHLERAELSGAYLEGAYLRGAHLEQAVFFYAYLEYASFVGAGLDRALLQGASAAGARFTSASLRFATLADADLRGASFSNADLRGADFLAAELAGASLRGARLEGAKLADQDASLVGNCAGATFDEATEFAADWSILPESEREAARLPWLARGMRRV